MRNRASRSRRRGRKSSAGFFVPFFVILLVGIILVLIFNLISSIFVEDSNGTASLHIERGAVDLRTWGTDKFFKLTLDTKILQGDEIKTSDSSSVILEMFDGTILRFSGGSDVIFEKMNEEDGIVNIILVNGSVWVNKIYKNSVSNYNIKNGVLNVNIPGQTILSISSDSNRHIAVISGDDVNVDVYNKETTTVVDTVEIGIGQQAIFSDAVLDRYWKFQSPNVLLGITDEFKSTTWYKTNLQKDTTQTSVVGDAEKSNDGFEDVNPVVMESDANLNPDIKNGIEDVPEEVLKNNAVDENLVNDIAEVPLDKKPPVIESVNGVTKPNDDGYFFVDVRLATLIGSVSGAKNVVVNGYTLSKFKEGDTEWKYFANADHSLMVPGKNTYEVYAIYSDGTRSESSYVNILFKQKFKSDASKTTVDADSNEAVSGANTAQTTDSSVKPVVSE